VDGADGDLARLQGRSSRFGAVFDAVLDRYADAAIVGGMVWWAWTHPEVPGPEPQPFAVGIAALTGFLLLSYSGARLEGEGFREVLSGPALFASRDVRLLLAALGSLAGQTYWTLVVLAGLSYAVIVWRFWLLSRLPEARQGVGRG
jgi:phosphatidylglycerophosphate synthase